MRHRFRILALVLAIIIPATMMSPNDAQASSECLASVVLIGVRGSGQPQDEGLPGFEGFGMQASIAAEKTFTALEESGHIVYADGLEYTADGAMDWAASAFLPGTPYWDSHQEGVDELIRTLQEYRECYPAGSPRIVLFGFSQGAHVIRSAMALSDDTIGEALDSQISAIVTVADPRFRGNEDPGLASGSWTDGNGLVVMAGEEIFPSRYDDDLHQLCDEWDLVCDKLGPGHAYYSEQELQVLGVWAAIKVLEEMPSVDDGGHPSDPPPSEPPAGPTVDGHYLPYPSGVSHIVTQGPNGSYSHSCPGNSCQAIDFDMELGDPIVASDNATVHSYDASGNNSTGLGKYVKLEHGDGWCSIYGHMNGLAATVTNSGVGASIERAQVLGYAGDTGWATGIHLHYALVDCDSWQSVDVDFVEVADPLALNWYTSQNTAPDSDGDGVSDANDECPNDYGELENGCPAVTEAGNQSSEPAVLNEDGVIHYFATADDGGARVVWRNPYNWAEAWNYPHGEQPPSGVNFVGTPTSIVNSWGTTQTFVVGDDGNVYFIWRNSAGEWTDNGWRKPGGRSKPAGVSFTGELNATLDANGDMWLFARASNGNIYTLRRHSSGWSEWHLPGGNTRPSGVSFEGTPSAVLNNDGVLHVFARGSDGNVYFLWRNSVWSNNGWILPSGEAAPSGIDFVGSPASIVNSWGTTQTFVAGDDGNVYFIWRNKDGVWTSNPWRLPGGNAAPAGIDFVGGLTAVLNFDDAMHVFAVADDGNVYALWRNPNRWAPEWKLPGGHAMPSGVEALGSPVSVVSSWNTTMTFVFGSDGNIYKLYRNAEGDWGSSGWVKPNGITAPSGVNLSIWGG